MYARYRWSRKLRSLQNRVFRPNHLNFQAASAEAVASLSQQDLPVTMVTSFPRSGNTWMRMMLTDIFAALISNELETKQIENSWIESHNLDNLRHLFLFRRPEDSLVSFYHFHCRPSGNQKLTTDGIDSFCLEHLGRWKMMTNSYLELAMRSTNRVHFVSYEDMLSEPELNLAQCFGWLGESIDSKIIAEAVDRNRFERAQENESSRQIDPNHSFFRRGTSDAGREELSDKTLKRIHLETSELMAQARSRITNEPRVKPVRQSSAA